MAAQVKAVAEEGRWIATQGDQDAAALEDRFHGSIEQGDIVLVLDDDGRIVGGLGIHPTGIEGVSNLGMSLLSEYRGHGWGRRLIEEGVAAAQRAGIRKVVLEVFTDNARAIALYVSSGFEIEGCKRDHYPRRDGSIRSALLMARFLRPRA